MQLALSVGLGLYMFIYAFEAPVRWLLNMVGADSLIFVRDFFIGVPVFVIFLHQLFTRKLHPAFFVYLALLLIHGTVSMLNIRSPFVIFYSAKMFLSMLAGALGARQILQPSKAGLAYFVFLWGATAVGVILDKYFVDFPWMGASTVIGGVEVEIARDWEVSGADKRAGGFMRSSIDVAFFEALISFPLLFNLPKALPKIFVALVTLFLIYCTTQKGAILAYGVTLAIFAISPKRPVLALKSGVLFFMAASVVLPIVMVQYMMPATQGVFSFASFYDRVEDMWPRAWTWIDQREIFPLGVGLGGIGGAQRFYAANQLNFADNLFLFLYAFFGIMTFVYLGWIAACVLRLGRSTSRYGVQALMVLVFFFADGCVLSMLEDQMGGLFFGIALSALGTEAAAQKALQKAKDKVISIPKWRVEAYNRRKALKAAGSRPALPGATLSTPEEA